jgi:peptidoglycan/xylan/chitin deacetylase (PgdA/CDA1 family)
MMTAADVYTPDMSLKGKIRRRLVRYFERRPAKVLLERAMVSFAFDDAPASAFETAGAMLEQRGLRGTYFISAALAGQDSVMGPYGTREDVLAAAAGGHEIACHTFSHLDCGAAGEAAIEDDIARNEQALAQWGTPRPTTFAYPYGDVSLAAKRVVGRRFCLSRGLHKGLIHRGTDLNQAPAIGIEGPAGGIYGRRWLEHALQMRAWVIFYTHDVVENPSAFGCTPSVFRELVDRARASPCDIVTVAEGARRVGAMVESGANL